MAATCLYYNAESHVIAFEYPVSNLESQSLSYTNTTDTERTVSDDIIFLSPHSKEITALSQPRTQPDSLCIAVRSTVNDTPHFSRNHAMLQGCSGYSEMACDSGGIV